MHTFFDSVYGWEYSLLEPRDFWDHVPTSWVAFYHFFNAPISSEPESKHSPLRVIKQLATKNDFIAFKLDVDTPTVEIPIALALLEPEYSNLVDEFFFELHFRDEVMMKCAWGDKIPDEHMGLKLNRRGALELFQKYRRAGIRSHFWP